MEWIWDISSFIIFLFNKHVENYDIKFKLSTNQVIKNTKTRRLIDSLLERQIDQFV